MKAARLDQILMRLGYINEEQISNALDRQRALGGRVGSHLVQLGYITNGQLTEALSEQFGVPGFDPRRHAIAPSIAERITLEEALRLQMMPFRVDTAKGAVHVALVNPDDEEAIEAVKAALGVEHVEMFVAPAATVSNLARTWLNGSVADDPRTLARFEPDAEPMITPSSFEMPPATGDEETHAPYNRTVGSLFRAVRLLADARAAKIAWRQPYGPICRDARDLSERFGLSRLATDGLQLAVYLLLPPRGRRGTGSNTGSLPVSEFAMSIEHARVIHFPWRIDEAMALFRDFHTEDALPAPRETASEVNLAAQILSLVWYRHVVFHDMASPGAEGHQATIEALRELAGPVAQMEMVDSYISMIDEQADVIDVDACHQILIVARTNDWLKHFTTRFSRAGFRTVWTDDLADAEKLCERHSPTVVLIDYDSYPGRLGEFSQVVKIAPQVLLFAMGSTTDPTVTLDLLDSGVDDVFTPPHDFDAITVRISRAVQGLARRSEKQRAGGFNATFDAFSFTDLVQTLAQSLKSVRIDLIRSTGEPAILYMEEGRMIHAACDELTGVEAVYRVIGWGDDGSFSVAPIDEFPEPNIELPNEIILMEGCRLLDESRV